jgi:hypothetical protein
VLIGVLIFALLLARPGAQMMLPFAGGFLLVGPAVLAASLPCGGRGGRAPGRGTCWRPSGGRRGACGCWPGCAALLFLIWMTDAATVYSFMIGVGRAGGGQVLRFHA